MKGSLWTIAVIIVFLALLIPAMGFSFDDALSENEVEEEPVILDADEPVAVDPPHNATSFSPTIDVITEDGELIEGDDYAWNSTVGEIETLENELDEEPAEVNYSYEYYTEETQDVMAVLGIIDGWIVALLLFVVIGAVVAMSNFGGGFGGR